MHKPGADHVEGDYLIRSNNAGLKNSSNSAFILMRGFGKSRKIMLTYQQPGCFMHFRHVRRLFKLPEKPFEER